MLWEMKKHYPNAHATFMSPNASASELRAASKAYWGYGEEGSRYAYAQQILEQMQQNGGIVGRQRGGSVGRISSQQLERLKKAQAGHNKAVTLAVKPIVVYEDEKPVEVATDAGLSIMPPTLPDGPGSAMASDYFFNLSLGAQ